MSETVTTPAGENVRAAAELKVDIAPPDKKGTDNAAASAAAQDVAEPAAAAVSSEPPPAHEAPVSTETSPALEAPPATEPPRDAPAPEAASPCAAAPAGFEIELKLLVDPDRLADFNDAPVIAANARNKGTRKHLKAIYYDTPERTLWQNGLSLRVRQSGTRFTQTVKAEAGDDPLRRGEWETNVPSLAPDINLAMPFIPEKLRDDIARAPLEAVFTTDIHRLQRMVDLPSGTVEIAFDHGSLRAGDRSQAVSEIELELTSGSTSAIYELALRLAEHGPVKPSIRGKSARGFDLAADTPPTARKPRRLRLDPQIALDDAFATILRACLHHLLQSLPAAEDGRDVEGIHQLRVSLRRLRAALHLMQSVGSLNKLELLSSEARWLAQNLSAARDLDIFQGATLPTIAKGCPSIAGFDDLSEVAERHRLAAYGKVRAALATRRCTSFVIELGGWIEARGWRSDVPPEGLGQLAEPALNFAHHMLAEQHVKVLKRGRHFKSLTAEKRHRLRLAVKKLRYVADFLLPLYGQRKSAKRYSEKLAEFQEELGSFNDMAVTASLLTGLGAAAGSTAAAAIAGWQAHAMVGTEARLRRAWRDFSKTRPPWAADTEDQAEHRRSLFTDRSARPD